VAKVIIVKDLGQYIRNKKDKMIRNMLDTLERHYAKILGPHFRSSKEWAEIRNTVLDSVNDFYGDVCLAMDNFVEEDYVERSEISHTGGDRQETPE
jgi:hypothetical protein